MSDIEMRELDAWIAENVMGKMISFGAVVYWHQLPSGEPKEIQDGPIDYYTSDPAAAMQVLEKCSEKMFSDCQDTNMCISKSVDGWIVDQITTGEDYGSLISSVGETIPITIALFAKQLFS